jgi:DNA-binding winged helix-turn-helix (wHTH) protein
MTGQDVLFRFGAFTLDPGTRQLLRGSQALRISPKAFQLLKVLVEGQPQAMSKSELHDRLWPGTFVSDANLAMLIREIRSALGDDARKPHFVRTLHGFGYAFAENAVGVARVQEPSVAHLPSYWLIWRRRKFALSQGDNLVGRSPEAHIWVDVAGVSREHARVTIDHGTATLEDLGSRNGTFRAGARISRPVILQDRDRIQLGPVLMTFRMWLPGAGTETQDVSAARPPAS